MPVMSSVSGKRKKEERKGWNRQEVNEELNIQSYNHLSNDEQTVLFYNQNWKQHGADRDLASSSVPTAQKPWVRQYAAA